ncbi:MAG: Nif3-like dinuclear metal center hexameric protein [Burkholderiaceae bacterium]
MSAIERQRLLDFLEETLQPQRFADYCPNGLQVEGAPRVDRVLCAVTASLAVLQEAARQGAQMVLVHHGWFWRGEDARVLGVRRARLAAALAHQINLVAYHLPLDVHPELGNNIQLARALGWPDGEAFGRDGLLRIADLGEPQGRAWDADRLASCLREGLAREPLLVGDLARPIRRVAWCTGAAQDSLEAAIEAGADAYVSGEISERTTHLAREAGVIYASAGHHATERFGVQALGQRLRDTFGVQVGFFDDPNPV